MYGKDSSGVGRAPLIDGDRRLVTASGGGRHAEAALAGRLFYVSTAAAVACSATLNNTFTGLAIVNPSTSGKNLIMHEFSYALEDSPSADTNLSLAVGPAHSGFASDRTPSCTRVGFKTTVTFADSAATITGASGIIVKHIATIGTNITTDLLTPTAPIDLGGQIIIVPGKAIYTDSKLGTGTVLWFAFMWEEVDV